MICEFNDEKKKQMSTKLVINILFPQLFHFVPQVKAEKKLWEHKAEQMLHRSDENSNLDDNNNANTNNNDDNPIDYVAEKARRT